MLSKLPQNHAQRMARARLALEGLSMGDAFGGKEFREVVPEIHLTRPPWRYSDDTVMARGVVEVLDRHGSMDQDELARIFATRYEADPYRGYGLTVRQVLERIHRGTPWNQSAQAVFNGVGSMGNGGAMRVAPLGAYFADDLDETVKQARASAEVTHAHPEGQAGTIATAVAAALAWRARDQERPREGLALLRTVLEYTPAGATRAGLEKSLTLGFDRTVAEATHVLGNGSRITAPDTVPFVLWCAARHLDNFTDALWAAASAGGDNDTNCAIVGGIVILANGVEAIPLDWLQAREPLIWNIQDMF